MKKGLVVNSISVNHIEVEHANCDRDFLGGFIIPLFYLQERWGRIWVYVYAGAYGRKRHDQHVGDGQLAHAVVGTLAEVACGSNRTNYVSFHRYVLGVLLDDVLVHATERLIKMSAGRYQLKRKEQGNKGRQAAGLDLVVHDDYSGQSRPVSTLSGGESFMAALALALGLSDVVQAHTGGVRLETLFVDEGFGSLDAEALELAVATLIDLQRTGRTIGVISHVQELKEQLDLRVDITRNKFGSSLRVIGPAMAL